MIRFAVAALAVLLMLCCGCSGHAQEVPTLVISDCDDPEGWVGVTAEREFVKEGKGAVRWDESKADAVSIKQVPADWKAYDRLSFWLYSPKATGSRFTLILTSENPATEGMDYYSASITVSFEGWKQFKYYLPRMSESRSPLGWDNIQGFRFTASGWGNEPDPGTVVIIDQIMLTAEGKEIGPRMTDQALFDSLNLEYPGLEKVAAAVKAGDLKAAKHELAQYYRGRQSPKWWFPLGDKANPPVANPNLSSVERVLNHELTSIGISYKFGPVIDWNFDVTTARGSTYNPNNEWTWQLNRHPHWGTLSRAYRDTGDEKYAREFVAQMTQWVRDCPLPEDAANGARSAWRTIETGIRSSGILWECWTRFLLSPEMTDEALVTFTKSIAEHALHLMAHHTSGNWLTMEGNGLFTVGVMLPEFKDAQKWRDTAIKWLYDEMNIQVYPDGVQVELSSGYHHVSLSNFLGAYKVANLNGVGVPDDYLNRLQKMYEFDVYAAAPDRRIPGVQDGDYHDVRGTLREASGLFPDRADFKWYATDGKEGAPPEKTSHAFDYAGYYCMRSGWEPDANYMLFDAGPFGYGHQHEDKLNLIGYAYGKRVLVDPGNYQYESSKWRQYFIDSPSHNVVMVDGQPQRRRGAADRSTYVTKEPLTNPWVSNADYDYVEGVFDAPFGGQVGTGVSHTRRVLFIKPDLWVVLDALNAKDGKSHTYDALFHFDAAVTPDAAGLKVFSANADAPNLAIAARLDPGLSLAIVEGRQNPVQGWLPASGISAVRPAPVAVFTRQGADTQILYVIAPARAGKDNPVAAVEPVAGSPWAAHIRLTDGRAFDVAFAADGPADLTIAGASGRGRALVVEKLADGQPGRRLTVAP
jgi:hypothetical protein